VEGVTLLFVVLAFAVLGSVIGLATGLLPGVHVNNVALVIVAASPALLGPLAAITDDAVLLLGAFLAAASVAHGMAALLPAVFLGAPDSDTALSVLPGHRLLARGRGHEAVLLGARGAFLGSLLALLLVLPFRLLLGEPVAAYAKLRPLMPLLLLLLIALLLATEGRRRDGTGAGGKRAWALALLLASGVLGWTVLRPGFLPRGGAPLSIGAESLVLFPLFVGLFGLPTLLMSMRTRGRLPPQEIGPPDPLPAWRRTRGLLSGTFAGASVSWIPGLGGTNATVVAQLLAGGEPKEDTDADREFLFAAGAAGAATTTFTLVALFVILRARSGVAAALDGLADGVPPWSPAGYVPPLLAAVLLALLVSAAVSYAATVRLARPFAVLAGRVRYGRLARGIAGALTVAVFLLSGPPGLLVLGTAAALGLVPPLVGVRRVHLMGCLVIPLLVSTW